MCTVFSNTQIRNRKKNNRLKETLSVYLHAMADNYCN